MAAPAERLVVAKGASGHDSEVFAMKAQDEHLRYVRQRCDSGDFRRPRTGREDSLFCDFFKFIATPKMKAHHRHRLQQQRVSDGGPSFRLAFTRMTSKSVVKYNTKVTIRGRP